MSLLRAINFNSFRMCSGKRSEIVLVDGFNWGRITFSHFFNL
jgi:hypothetical protein